jgi:hypothetical protein
MDPLSVTASVLQITTACLKTVKTLDALRQRFQNARTTIAALCSESILVSAALSNVQGLFLANNDALTVYLRGRPELASALDIALTGCAVVYACLEEEIRKLDVDPQTEGRDGWARQPGWRTRGRLLWNEETMKEYLGQIRGQQAALTLLIQGLQM